MAACILQVNTSHMDQAIELVFVWKPEPQPSWHPTQGGNEISSLLIKLS